MTINPSKLKKIEVLSWVWFYLIRKNIVTICLIVLAYILGRWEMINVLKALAWIGLVFVCLWLFVVYMINQKNKQRDDNNSGEGR